MGDTPNAPAPATAPAEAIDPKAQTPSGQTPAAPSGDSTGNPVKDAAAAAVRKLKIDEQEVDEQEVIKTYKERKEHQRAANKNLQEGLKAKKQAEEFISMMKDKGKLFDVLKKLGHDPRKLSEEYLAEVLADEMLDPKDKELRNARQKLQSYEEREKQQLEELESKERDILKAKFAEQYSKEFVEALKTTGLPPTKDMVAAMAKYVARAAQIKMPMSAIEAAKLVQQDEEMRYKHRLANADPETIAKILGEEGLKKVRGYDTSRIKDPNANLNTPAEQGGRQKRDPDVKRMTPEEWRAFNRK